MKIKDNGENINNIVTWIHPNEFIRLISLINLIRWSPPNNLKTIYRTNKNPIPNQVSRIIDHMIIMILTNKSATAKGGVLKKNPLMSKISNSLRKSCCSKIVQ